MNAFWQMFAVAHAEFRFGLRRGGPVVGTAAVGLVVGAGTLYLTFMNAEGMPRAYAASAGASALAMVWPAFQWLALGVLPIVCAPAIPSDRQFGVDELLHSTPLTGGIYLAGKVLGVVATVLLTGTLVLMLHLGLHWALIGPINSGLYFELTLLNGLPLLLWASAMGVLAASGLRTRRTAIFIGILVGILSPYPWALAFRPPSDLRSFQGTASMLSRQPISDFVFQRYDLLPPWVSPVTSQQVFGIFFVALLTLIVVAVAARLRLLRQDNF
jgi:ABC-type multidrug transport system permease subunit